MRRNVRRRRENKNIWKDKKIISGAIIVTVIVIIAGFNVLSSNDRKNKTKQNQSISLETEQKSEDNIDDTTESASSSIGNTIKDAQEQNKTSVETNKIENQTNSIAKQNTANIEPKRIKTTEENTAQKETTTTNSNIEENKKISFKWPVKGEILKSFSMDNLLYSATLKEWTTHNGIDIKADKASVVSASADGTVKSIKNDPRYGLTVTIEHKDGYKTVYANLLTAEFVVEGEKIKQGQNIGTVGNTANFEISDGFHLHFEILKDSQNVDPMIYLK